MQRVSRFRLRVLLQELSLVEGETFIGRSAECQLTLEDSLVSRVHAKIVVKGEVASVEDLGSRNGVRINGEKLVRPHVLVDGDRIGIGSQDMRFYAIADDAGAQPSRETGWMRSCSKCRLPFAADAPACPGCGTLSAAEAEVVTSEMRVADDEQRVWKVRFALDVVTRALRDGKSDRALEPMKRLRDEFEASVKAKLTLPGPLVADVARVASAFGALPGNDAWAAWGQEIARFSA